MLTIEFLRVLARGSLTFWAWGPLIHGMISIIVAGEPGDEQDGPEPGQCGQIGDVEDLVPAPLPGGGTGLAVPAWVESDAKDGSGSYACPGVIRTKWITLDCAAPSGSWYSSDSPPAPGGGVDRQRLREIAKVRVVKGCHCDADQYSRGKP